MWLVRCSYRFNQDAEIKKVLCFRIPANSSVLLGSECYPAESSFFSVDTFFYMKKYIIYNIRSCEMRMKKPFYADLSGKLFVAEEQNRTFIDAQRWRSAR